MIDMDLEYRGGVDGLPATSRGIPKVDALQIIQPSTKPAPPPHISERLVMRETVEYRAIAKSRSDPEASRNLHRGNARI